ncbi:hypothetical protein BURMUCF1_2343 [Burkholderia multivorans ATCC BAA-247]|nr:hypothetical protein BURMUCF1_2343 [Burkholderia multivorans ATCC BAA-247]
MCHGCCFLLLELEWCGAGVRRAMPAGPSRDNRLAQAVCARRWGRPRRFQEPARPPRHDARRVADSI